MPMHCVKRACSSGEYAEEAAGAELAGCAAAIPQASSVPAMTSGVEKKAFKKQGSTEDF
jgi:hypothetical protein